MEGTENLWESSRGAATEGTRSERGLDDVQGKKYSPVTAKQMEPCCQGPQDLKSKSPVWSVRTESIEKKYSRTPEENISRTVKVKREATERRRCQAWIEAEDLRRREYRMRQSMRGSIREDWGPLKRSAVDHCDTTAFSDGSRTTSNQSRWASRKHRRSEVATR